MIIEKNLAPYAVFSQESISVALKRINANKSRFVCCVTEHGILEGILTDGDFRRWVTSCELIDLEQEVGNIANKNYLSVDTSIDAEKIASMLDVKVPFVPVTDAQNRLVSIALLGKPEIQLGEFCIGEGNPAFVIAEIGINHNGQMDLAKKLVDEAVDANADCVKFQMRDMGTLYRNEGNPDDDSEDLGSQYVLDVLSRSQLSTEQMIEIFDYSKEKGIMPLCTPWDSESLKILEEYGMDGYKVASADLTNHDLLLEMAVTRKPIILSTGMSSESEIRETVSMLKKNGAVFIVLHCNSTYPAPFKDVQLNYMDRLKELCDCPVGYSGHERGYAIPVAAVARGAKVIEKHFTLDRNMIGNDHKVSLLPHEFKAMVESIRNVEEAIGEKGANRRMSQGELMNRENLAKSIVAAVAIKKGDVISESKLAVKSPGKGLQPNNKNKLIGQVASRDMAAGDFFFQTDLSSEKLESRTYKFNRPWGIPVRYHDYRKLKEWSNPDFLEFHLSFKDMKLDLHQYFDEPLDMDLVVHSPDFFEGDFLLNLAAEDDETRRRSITELQRVIDITRELKQYFSKATTPFVVVSVGGFSKNTPLPYDARKALYSRVADSLSKLDASGVEILPQTLPPFPWYFGGQLYCNIFVDPDDTKQFCEDYGYKLCFDVSHSKLASNHKKMSFMEMTEKLGQYAGHLHIVDAEGVDGEGVQIEEGEIDFVLLANQLEKLSPNASFIPEIWQGHKNNGEGFWIALNRLEKYF